VVETQPRAEGVVQAHLSRQRFASFCPRFRKTRRHARRTDEVVVPVFPGYLFVTFEPERDNWTAINGTRGVRQLVGLRSSRPQAMPVAAMQALFARCEGELITNLCPALATGQRVRLLTGPFVDRMGEVERLAARGRVRVLLDVLGGRTPLAVSARDLAPA
jgi:transcriptional antiterminator RfaH